MDQKHPVKNILLTLFLLSGNLFAIDKFALECNNESTDDDIKKIFFFNKIKRFTGYYSTFDEQTLNSDGIKVKYTSERNKCKFDGDEGNRYFFNCKSDYVGFETRDNSVGIDQSSLVMLRSATTAKYGYPLLGGYSCKTLDTKKAEGLLKNFKQDKKNLDKEIKNQKKQKKAKNQI